tara:strand:+ start:959 stop:1360 length:402 start_codon:yes stop_codon:yes gene_type:complete
MTSSAMITTGTVAASAIDTTLTNTIISSVDVSAITSWDRGDLYIFDDNQLTQPHPYELRLQRIEKVLGIVNRDPVLEAEFPDLAVIGDAMDGVLATVSVSELEAISSAAVQYTSFADECNIMRKLKLNNDPID